MGTSAAHHDSRYNGRDCRSLDIQTRRASATERALHGIVPRRRTFPRNRRRSALFEIGPCCATLPISCENKLFVLCSLTITKLTQPRNQVVIRDAPFARRATML